MVEGAGYAFSRQSKAALVAGEVFSVAGSTVLANSEAVPVKCVAFLVSFMKLFLQLDKFKLSLLLMKMSF
jgi:hypothetical protein